MRIETDTNSRDAGRDENREKETESERARKRERKKSVCVRVCLRICAKEKEAKTRKWDRKNAETLPSQNDPRREIGVERNLSRRERVKKNV